jgi:phosphatidyl-myo-inositol dimannoside synthase
MKTLLLTHVFPPKTGGSGRWFWEIYGRLPREEFVVAAGQDPRQEAFDQTHDLRLHRLPLSLPTWGLASPAGLKGYGRALRQLNRIVKAEGVGMLHCGCCLPEGVMALLLKHWRGLPYACYVHGEELNLAAGSRELRWLAGRALKGAAFLVANSRNTVRLLCDGWGLPAERVRLLHPGVDTTRFVPAERDPAVRARLGWGERPVVLTVGRLQKRKGHDRMIQALRTVRHAVPDVLYAVAGDGEERPTLEGLVREAGLSDHVAFLGEVTDDDLIRCYQQCDLFVLPNRQVGQDIEGFGMVLLEAQSCGKPVVAGASGGTAETMDIPATGQVVNCDGPNELAALVTELLRDQGRRAAMGAAARRWVVSRFDWEALTRQAKEVFAEGLPGAAPSAPVLQGAMR